MYKKSRLSNALGVIKIRVFAVNYEFSANAWSERTITPADISAAWAVGANRDKAMA